MRPFAFVTILPILAACATPQERCLNTVSAEMRVIDRLVNQTSANITRGFALEQRDKLHEVRKFCRVEQDDGSILTTRCDTVEIRQEQHPVAIDLNAEKAKLASLQDRQSQMRRDAVAARQQCIARNPG